MIDDDDDNDDDDDDDTYCYKRCYNHQHKRSD